MTRRRFWPVLAAPLCCRCRTEAVATLVVLNSPPLLPAAPLLLVALAIGADGAADEEEEEEEEEEEAAARGCVACRGTRGSRCRATRRLTSPRSTAFSPDRPNRARSASSRRTVPPCAVLPQPGAIR